MEEPSIGEKLLLAGLETCDKVGEERITLACRLLHLCPAQAVNVLWCLIFECQLLSRWLMSDDNKNYNDENDDDDDDDDDKDGDAENFLGWQHTTSLASYGVKGTTWSR